MLVTILLIVIITQFFAMILLWNNMRQKQKPKTINNTDAVIVDWLKLIMRQPNPFLELIHHSELARTGKASAIEGIHTIDYLFQELETRGKLQQIETYNSVVSFNPSVHRSFEQFKPGENVRVVDPGWKYDTRIFIYPIVASVERT